MFTMRVSVASVVILGEAHKYMGLQSIPKQSWPQMTTEGTGTPIDVQQTGASRFTQDYESPGWEDRHHSEQHQRRVSVRARQQDVLAKFSPRYSHGVPASQQPECAQGQAYLPNDQYPDSHQSAYDRGGWAAPLGSGGTQMNLEQMRIPELKGMLAAAGYSGPTGSQAEMIETLRDILQKGGAEMDSRPQSDYSQRPAFTGNDQYVVPEVRRQFINSCLRGVGVGGRWHV